MITIHEHYRRADRWTDRRQTYKISGTCICCAKKTKLTNKTTVITTLGLKEAQPFCICSSFATSNLLVAKLEQIRKGCASLRHSVVIQADSHSLQQQLANVGLHSTGQH